MWLFSLPNLSKARNILTRKNAQLHEVQTAPLRKSHQWFILLVGKEVSTKQTNRSHKAWHSIRISKQLRRHGYSVWKSATCSRIQQFCKPSLLEVTNFRSVARIFQSIKLGKFSRSRDWMDLHRCFGSSLLKVEVLKTLLVNFGKFSLKNIQRNRPESSVFLQLSDRQEEKTKSSRVN